MGGILAFEVAQQLHTQGRKVALLALLDSHSINGSTTNTVSRDVELFSFRERIRFHLSSLLQLKPEEKLTYIWKRVLNANKLMRMKIWKMAYKGCLNLRRPLPRALRNIEFLNYEAVKAYKLKMQSYPGHITLMATDELVRRFQDPQLGWDKQLAPGGLETYTIPCGHDNMLDEPHVRTVAEQLKASLDKAIHDQ
jgi:aspartate racemase